MNQRPMVETARFPMEPGELETLKRLAGEAEAAKKAINQYIDALGTKYKARALSSDADILFESDGTVVVQEPQLVLRAS